MSRGADVSVTTLLTVSIILCGVLLGPLISPIIMSAPEVQEPLRVGSATIEGDFNLEQSDFGARTYHFTSLDIVLGNVVGSGVVVVQIGVPGLNAYVLTREFDVQSPTPSNQTIRYQPSVEIHPEVVEKESYLAKVTVRLRSSGESRIVAEREFEMEVIT